MNLVTFVFLRKTSLKFWTQGPGRMSGGMTGGGEGLGTRDRGWGSGVSAEGGSRISRGERVEGVSWTLDTPG